MTNPFTPNFGQVPVNMAGREMLISEMIDAFNSDVGHPNLTTLFIGARGTGKTALLTALSKEAEQNGWIAVNVSSIKGLLDDIADQAARKSSQIIDESSKRKLTGFSVGQFLELQWENINSGSSTWRGSMTELIESLNQQNIGLLITVDEVDPKLEEMTQLVSIYQHFVRENRKVSLLMAGLPHKVSQLLNGESVSFLRRAAQYKLGNIEDYEVEASLKDTIGEYGKAIDDNVLKESVEAIGGFPFMMQLVGFRMWESAKNRNKISGEDVKKGIALAEKDMKTRVLKATLDELSEGDLLFLELLLKEGAPSTVKAIQSASDKGTSFASTYKRRLLERGVIKQVGRSKVDFALPTLSEYLEEYLVTFE